MAGTLAACSAAVAAIGAVVDVLSVSRPFPNHRDPGFRVYVTARLRTGAGEDALPERRVAS